MEQLLHGRATTTTYIRQKIQKSTLSIAKLAAHYNINPNTFIRKKETMYKIGLVVLKTPALRF